MDLERAVYETCEKNREKLAQEMGKSYSLIARYANPNDEVNFSILHTIPLMKITKNYIILKVLARETGHVVVKLPKHLPKVGPKTVAELQGDMLGCVRILMDFSGGQTGSTEAKTAIYDLVEKLMTLHRVIDKGNELKLEEVQTCLPLE